MTVPLAVKVYLVARDIIISEEMVHNMLYNTIGRDIVQARSCESLPALSLPCPAALGLSGCLIGHHQHTGELFSKNNRSIIIGASWSEGSFEKNNNGRPIIHHPSNEPYSGRYSGRLALSVTL